MKTLRRKFPRSVAKYIRKEKARIRKSGVQQEELSRKFVALYDTFVNFKKS